MDGAGASARCLSFFFLKTELTTFFFFALLQASTLLLKKAVALGMTMYDIGLLFAANRTKTESSPSEFSIVYQTALSRESLRSSIGSATSSSTPSPTPTSAQNGRVKSAVAPEMELPGSTAATVDDSLFMRILEELIDGELLSRKA
jgi:hypothetical protein